MKNHSEMVGMLVLIFGVDQYVVDEHNGKHVQVWFEYLIHMVHKSCRCIGQTKRHNKKIEETIMGLEGHL